MTRLPASDAVQPKLDGTPQLPRCSRAHSDPAKMTAATAAPFAQAPWKALLGLACLRASELLESWSIGLYGEKSASAKCSGAVNTGRKTTPLTLPLDGINRAKYNGRNSKRLGQSKAPRATRE
jgi:hypothetical protein